MSTKFSLILVALFSFYSARSLAADGATVYSANCVSCHGPNSVGLPIPVLDGMNKKYFIKTMADYKSGARVDNTMNAMNCIVSSLDTATISSLADYVFTLNPCEFPASIVSPGLGDPVAGKAVIDQKSCLACHKTPSPINAPMLEGQKTVYLTNQMFEYHDGKRKNGMMNNAASALTEREINDLSAYFNSVRNCEPLPTPSPSPSPSPNPEPSPAPSPTPAG